MIYQRQRELTIIHHIFVSQKVMRPKKVLKFNIQKYPKTKKKSNENLTVDSEVQQISKYSTTKLTFLIKKKKTQQLFN